MVLLVSDYASLEELYSRMGVCESKTDAAKLSLEVGFDMEFPTPNVYTEELKVQIEKGKINPLLLDQAVSRVLTEKFELGLFEEPFPKSEEVINQTFSDVDAKEVSLSYARESMTLLKNNGLLPINLKGKKVAVIGHLATSVRSLSWGVLLYERSGVGNGRSKYNGWD